VGHHDSFPSPCLVTVSNLPAARAVFTMTSASSEETTMTRGRMLLAGGACLMLITLAGAAAWAKNGVVTTRDGQRYEGDVAEKGDYVVVTVKGGIPVTI